jgi:hypothetical protein
MPVRKKGTSPHAFIHTAMESHQGLRLPGAANHGARARRWSLRLPSLNLGEGQALVPSLGRAAREQRAQEKEQQKRLVSIETAKEAFFQTPAGRARRAYKRGHRLFQYELEVDTIEPTLIPGPLGGPAQETTDPVDILNSVTVEGWKLVTGKFIHTEMQSGVIGCYLFKRSEKRRQRMNDPWKALPEESEAPTGIEPV